MDSKQAMAAIGQPKLMRFYDEIFGSFGLRVAQCLMTYRDFEDESAKQNTRNTLNKLLEHGYIPIINENDTVSVEEIMLGDNDKLSALVTVIMDADLLVLASDMNGLHTGNPHLDDAVELIEEVRDLEEVMQFVQERDSEHGTGGMTSKIEAAKICAAKNTEMWIVNGGKDNFLVEALSGALPCTKFKF